MKNLFLDVRVFYKPVKTKKTSDFSKVFYLAGAGLEPTRHPMYYLESKWYISK